MFNFYLSTYWKTYFRFRLTSGIVLLLLLFQNNFSYAQWSRKKDAITKRTELMNVLYKGKLYNFNGFSTWPIVDPSAEVYDPVRNEWTMLAPMPAKDAVTHQGIVVVDDKVWHIGGRLNSTTGYLTSQVWIYDITKNRWRRGPSLRDPATGKLVRWGGGGAALIGRTIHVVGGFIFSTCNSDQDKYHFTLDVDKWLADPQNTSWENKLKPLPIKRNHISTTVLNGKLYVIGGQFGHDCGGGHDQKYSHVYNPLTDTWTRLTDLPMVRSHCEASIFPVDGKIYIGTGDGGTNQFTRFNPEANNGRGSWANLPAYTLRRGYIGAAAKVIGDRLYFTCGRLENTRNIRAETMAAPFARNISYKLGFLEDCLNQTIESDKKVTLTNLIYTAEGEKNYRLTSNARWLSISKNSTGLANQTGTYTQVTVNTNGLKPGNYKAIITAQGTGSGKRYANASFCVNVKVTQNQSGFVLTVNKTGSGSVVKNPDKTRYANGETVKVTAKPARGYQFTGWSGSISGKANPVSVVMKGNRTITANFKRIQNSASIVRINAGGSSQTINGVSWQGCASKGNCDDYVTGGFAYTENSVPTIQGARLHNMNQAIYRTEWTGGEKGTGAVPVGATAFKYRIPVKNGSYLVRLYFVELNKNGKNQREFDIKLEGKLIFNNFDIYEAAHGMYKAIVREIPVTISDGLVNIDFIRQIQNAKVSAIEIIPLNKARLNSRPIADAGPDRVVTATSGGKARVTLNGAASTDEDGYLVAYRWLVNGQDLGNGISKAVNLEVGTHEVRLIVKDNAGAYRSATTTITVKRASATQEEPVIAAKEATAQPKQIEKVIEPLTQVLTLKIYPNPGEPSERTFLEIENGGKQETLNYILYDITGQLVLSSSLLTDEFGQARTELNITDKVSAGTYLLKVYGTAGAAQTKLIIK